MMDIDSEIRRLVELMPASGRMLTKIISKPQQSRVIDCKFPRPWERGDRPIAINFTLWEQLSQPQRDLLLLSTVSRLTGIRWFKPDIYQGLTVMGLGGVALQLWQKDVVGLVAAAGLTAIAANQIWRNYRSEEREIEADETAMKVATRRGYEATEAANYLLSAIEKAAKIENRTSLNFTELIRCQNLRVKIGNQVSKV
ncbi:MAG: DUF3318 domain-containing protein [Snowella sp.]|nr:DUF3318 domain-containing protein [Snowella sp.]